MLNPTKIYFKAIATFNTESLGEIKREFERNCVIGEDSFEHLRYLFVNDVVDYVYKTYPVVERVDVEVIEGVIEI